MDPERKTINEAIRTFCSRQFGVLDSTFLCQSLGMLNLREPRCLPDHSSTADVVELLQAERIGCLLLTDSSGKLSGIFTERDVLIKVAGKGLDVLERPVSEFMTPQPQVQPPETTIAYALNLMSLGGYRHLPVVDASGQPVGVVSVRDIVDFIVETMTNDLLEFEVGSGG